MNKINSTTKTVLVLTVIGYMIPTVYLNIFDLSFLLYQRWLTSSAEIIRSISCIIVIVIGIRGIFWKKANKGDRKICSICTLLCFIAYISMLFFVSDPAEISRRISCTSNLKTISLALLQYNMDYAGYYPPANGAAGLETLRKNDYLTDYDVFTCPSTKTVCGKNNQPLTEANVDYVYIGGLNTKSAPNLPLLYDKSNNHGYFGNVLFADCSVAGIYGNPWTQNIKR